MDGDFGGARRIAGGWSKAKKPPQTDDLHGHLMKYGPDPNHWSEYIHCAYEGHQREAVFLTGIPDIRESLPHG